MAIDLSTGKVMWSTKLPSSPYGAATVTNDLVFTTTFNGKLIAMNRSTGKIVWQQQLPAGTNAPVAIDGDTLVTAAGFPSGKGQKPRSSPTRCRRRAGSTHDSSDRHDRRAARARRREPPRSRLKAG